MAHTSDADVLEWTVSEGGWWRAGLEEALLGESLSEVERSLPTTAPRPAIPWRQWGLLAGAALGVLAAVWLITAWDTVTAHLALRQLITREIAAEQAGDTTTLVELSIETEAVWLEQRLDRAANSLPAWMPVRGLRPATEPPTLETLTLLTPELAQADFARVFNAPDGKAYNFRLAQFYTFSEEMGWRRAPTPERYWGPPRRLFGEYVEMSYYTQDTEFAADLLEYLDSVLARTCEVWECPLGQPLQIELGNRYLLPPDVPALLPDDPLLFAVLPPHLTRFPYALLVPSPHEVGYPADEAAQRLVNRAIATQVLFAAADRFAFGKRSGADVGNAFLYALVARRAVQLGLDSSTSMNVTPVPVTDRMTADRLWNFRTGPWQRPDILRNTLALVNSWLPPNGGNTDVELLRQLGAAQSLEEWLVLGLGVTSVQAQQMVQAGLAPQ